MVMLHLDIVWRSAVPLTPNPLVACSRIKPCMCARALALGCVSVQICLGEKDFVKSVTAFSFLESEPHRTRFFAPNTRLLVIPMRFASMFNSCHTRIMESIQLHRHLHARQSHTYEQQAAGSKEGRDAEHHLPFSSFHSHPPCYFMCPYATHPLPVERPLPWFPPASGSLRRIIPACRFCNCYRMTANRVFSAK